MTQKATMRADDETLLLVAKAHYERALRQADAYREVVVAMVDEYSYREVARVTGLSTNTLQRWKREAGK